MSKNFSIDFIEDDFDSFEVIKKGNKGKKHEGKQQHRNKELDLMRKIKREQKNRDMGS